MGVLDISDDQEILGLAGDWHGNWRWAVACIDAFGAAGVKTVFQVGDFGIWHGQYGDEYLGKVRKALEGYDMTIYVTLGNHEDYDLVDAHEKDDQGIAWFRHNIAVLPRVFSFEFRGKRYLSLGGAPSIDFETRVFGVDWWPQEMVSDEDVDLAINTAEEMGGVDVMLTHDAPDGGTWAVRRILEGNPQGWSRKALNYAAEGRMRMNRAVYSIEPGLLVHGHYHVVDYGYLNYGETKDPGLIVSLNPDGCVGNAAIMKTDDPSDITLSMGRQNIHFDNKLGGNGD